MGGYLHGAAIDSRVVEFDDRAPTSTQHIRVLQEKGGLSPLYVRDEIGITHPGSPPNLAA